MLPQVAVKLHSSQSCPLLLTIRWSPLPSVLTQKIFRSPFEYSLTKVYRYWQPKTPNNWKGEWQGLGARNLEIYRGLPLMRFFGTRSHKQNRSSRIIFSMNCPISSVSNARLSVPRYRYQSPLSQPVPRCHNLVCGSICQQDFSKTRLSGRVLSGFPAIFFRKMFFVRVHIDIDILNQLSGIFIITFLKLPNCLKIFSSRPSFFAIK